MIVKTRIAGVLLAAGEGSRLGSPKALVELGGIRLVDRGIALLRDGGTAPVVAVTGAAVVDLLGVITVHNPDWRSGMGSSLAVGLGSVPASCDAAVVALVDQPLIGPGSVRRLIAAYRAGAGVAVAAYHGKPRNPVLLVRADARASAACARARVRRRRGRRSAAVPACPSGPGDPGGVRGHRQP